MKGDECLMKKPNWTQVVGIGGTVLGLVASIASNYASKKQQEETIAKEVQKALQNQNQSK